MSPVATDPARDTLSGQGSEMRGEFNDRIMSLYRILLIEARTGGNECELV